MSICLLFKFFQGPYWHVSSLGEKTIFPALTQSPRDQTIGTKECLLYKWMKETRWLFWHLDFKAGSRLVYYRLKGALRLSWETRSQTQGKWDRNGDSWAVSSNCKDPQIKLCRGTELCGMAFIYGMSVCSHPGQQVPFHACTAPVFQIPGNVEKHACKLTGCHCISRQTSTLFGQTPIIGEISVFTLRGGG